MNQAALSELIGYDRPYVSRVLAGNYGIGLRFACALEDAGLGRARDWLHAQADYDLMIERKS